MSTTRQSGSGYDERYSTPLEANRRGAHRARPNPILSMLPFVAVAVVVLGVVAGAWVMFGGNRSGGTTSEGTSALPSLTSAAPSASGSAPSPTATATESASATPTKSATPSPTVDRKAELVVLNGTTTGGLGGRVASKLKSAGWAVPAAASDYRPKPFAETTVFYAKKSEKATAQAVADELGPGYRIERDAGQATDGITVIIGSDYQE